MLTELLNNYGKLGVEALKQDVQKVSATGQTAESLRYEVTKKDTVQSLTFYARAFFKALETGRGPRKSSEYQEYDKRLEEYLTTRGIESKVSKSGIKYFKLGKSWMSAKGLAYKINKEGDSVYKKGGRVVYTPTIQRLIEEITAAVKKDTIGMFIAEIRSAARS